MWESKVDILLGSRVIVSFRNKKTIGIVISSTKEKPTYKTLPIEEILDLSFFPISSLNLAKKISQENLCSLEKVLSISIPKKFFHHKAPEIREKYISLINNQEQAVRGSKQKLLYTFLQDNGTSSVQKIRENFSLSIIQSLEKKKLIKINEGNIIPAFRSKKLISFTEGITLTHYQTEAIKQINETPKPSLLFGVTGSGKTEVYRHLINHAQQKNKKAQVLLLVPEISLTPQLLEYFYGYFKHHIAVWHSNLSEGEKIQEWKRISNGEATIIIGTRSAALLPFVSLDLAIMDEEHEWTYKNEFAPRFWTHRILEIFAKISGTKLVFGSATPRIESIKNIDEKKWTMVKMPFRVSEISMPEISIVDMRNESKKGNHSPLSEKLHENIETTLQRKKQIILFLNRRGYCASSICKYCGYVFECSNCNVTMKLHKRESISKLICHFCGLMKNFPSKCPSCSTTDFQFKGWGTQQLEMVLTKTFPQARIIRADRDTVTGKYDFERILQKFHNKEGDILIGTQMISKGLDFEDIELCGIISADIGLGIADFSAEERVFQVLSQVAGRAGRRKRVGKVVIQTYNPTHRIFGFLKENGVESFLSSEKEIRKNSSMPPYSVIAKFTFAHENKDVSFSSAKNFYNQLQKIPNLNQDSVFFAPAFIPMQYRKYFFHTFIRSTSFGELYDILKIIPIPSDAKVDIAPSSIL